MCLNVNERTKKITQCSSMAVMWPQKNCIHQSRCSSCAFSCVGFLPQSKTPLSVGDLKLIEGENVSVYG